MALTGAEQKLSWSSEAERQEECRALALVPRTWGCCGTDSPKTTGQFLEHRAYPRAHLQKDDVEPNVFQDRPMMSFSAWDWAGLP